MCRDVACHRCPVGFGFGSPDRKHAMLTTGDKTISALFRSQRGTLLRCNVRNISLVNVSERICKIEKGSRGPGGPRRE